jgi:hypothetical protein
VAENAWILMKRESVITAVPHDPNDQAVMKQFETMIFEAKLKEAMSTTYQEARPGLGHRQQAHRPHEARPGEPAPGQPGRRQREADEQPQRRDPQRQGRRRRGLGRPRQGVHAAVSPEDRAAREAFQKGIAGPKGAAPRSDPRRVGPRPAIRSALKQPRVGTSRPRREGRPGVVLSKSDEPGHEVRLPW